jgi:hypothetical protein
MHIVVVKSGELEHRNPTVEQERPEGLGIVLICLDGRVLVSVWGGAGMIQRSGGCQRGPAQKTLLGLAWQLLPLG